MYVDVDDINERMNQVHDCQPQSLKSQSHKMNHKSLQTAASAQFEVESKYSNSLSSNYNY